MECMMQNLADSLADNMGAPLPVGRHDLLSTFMVHSQRRKVTSSAKRKRDPKATNLRQTPEGSFWDLMANARDVLSLCGVDTPELTPVQEYLSTGPSFIFLFHPALGPLWEVVAQKIQGGALTRGSELVLEVAEARLHNVVVDGSLLVEADDVMGHMAVAAAPTPTVGARNGDGPVGDSTGISRDDWTESPSASDDSTSGRDEDAGPSTNGSFARPEDSGAAERRLVFGCGCGRVWMENVRIRNRGVDWTNPGNVYWKCEVARHQAARVVLRGRSEFSAVDVEIDGDQVFEVPHGCRMDVRGDGRGGFVATLASVDEPSWEWTYEPREDGGVRLELLQERGRC
ncbi:unnamed protein product [Ostreobium quekettii]|uniref:UGP3-like C-terminal hexapeptide repeats domain-containing protein n=1 Tax=Ostreobium quekettii TaxID=121088 RepID=A0A8S1J8B1_9CHLO|nr:unnamed protein product [Ostreobium quekettii]